MQNISFHVWQHKDTGVTALYTLLHFFLHDYLSPTSLVESCTARGKTLNPQALKMYDIYTPTGVNTVCRELLYSTLHIFFILFMIHWPLLQSKVLSTFMFSIHEGA